MLGLWTTEPLHYALCLTLCCSMALSGQNNDANPESFMQCFPSIDLSIFQPSNHQEGSIHPEFIGLPQGQLTMEPSLVVFRKLEPSSIEELYVESEGEFFKSRRSVGAPWNKFEPADSLLGDFVKGHWSALRDDMMKPFRLKQTLNDEALTDNGTKDQASSVNKSIEQQKLELENNPAQETTYTYALFFRDICVNRAFNNKDFDARWAELNTTFIFNQTLKLTKMHHIMDSVFLHK